MYTDEQFEQLEQEEHSLTEEAIDAIFLLSGITEDNLKKELRNFYQKYGKDGVVTYTEARRWVSEKDHRKRMVLLFLWIATEFDLTFAEFTTRFKDHLKTIISMELNFFNLSDDILDFDKILGIKWGVDNLNWEQRLLAYQEKWVTVLSDDLKVAFLKRAQIKDVLSDLDKRFISMEKILWRLYVTESTAIGSLARKEIFKELGIKKYRFYAREDERTCEHCGSLHGLIFPISAYEIGVTASPIHAHCRCWEVPIQE